MSAKLPLILSVPHAGLDVPEEVASRSVLTPEQIAADGDVGAQEIYSLEDSVERFATTRVGRAFLDLNREASDRSKDGCIKTHTCWDEPVYDRPLEEDLAGKLIERYWRPYHEKLSSFAKAAPLAIDCHTMAAIAPPIAPDPGRKRPRVCLSDGDGATCPKGWMIKLAECLTEAFEEPASVNSPFRGGYITRTHAFEMPWVQLELSREEYDTFEGKRARVLKALTEFCKIF